MQQNKKRIEPFAFLIAVVMASLLTFGITAAARSGLGVQNPIRLDQKIDINSAPSASLVRLPGIGISRAQAIIEHRTLDREADSRSRAFRNWRDLQKIHGIGPVTASKLSPWLTFENENPDVSSSF